MLVHHFDYTLPRNLVASHPARPRDTARLLDITGQEIENKTILDLPDLLNPNDLLVVNNTKVIPSRLVGRRGRARVEATLHKHLRPGCWAAFARPGRRLRPGDTVEFSGSLKASVVSRDSGEVVLDFGMKDDALLRRLVEVGRMPLPPYIKRTEDQDGLDDRKDYQSIFAKREGAVAAPTASLHFTDRILTALEQRGINRVSVTLHVGAGTFLPVTTEDTDDHVMHSEWGEVSQDVVAAVEKTRARGGRVISIGTTVLRILETAGQTGHLQPHSGETNLFISPGFRFHVVDLLLTNFHLPRSTLLILVSAFTGHDRMLEAYNHAIAAGYRFFSYGDACLMKRQE